MTDFLGPVTLRSATPSDIAGIVTLVNGYAEQAIMLPRTPESVWLALPNFIVAVNASDEILACAALKEYSPSLGEVASVAVAREAHGHGLGARMVDAVEQLARKRGIEELIALTLTPAFFERVGYQVTDRALYPEKIRRECLRCPRRIQCAEVCVARALRDEMAVAA